MPPPVEPLATLVDEKNAWKTGPPLPPGWQDTLVGYLEAKGTYALACKRTGVSDETVRKYRHLDPAFDERCRWAREVFADTVEEKLLDIGERSDDPVPSIVMLKKLRPQEYVEKYAVMNFNVSTTLDPADGADVLRDMFATLRATTHALITPQETGSAPIALAPRTELEEPR